MRVWAQSLATGVLVVLVAALATTTVGASRGNAGASLTAASGESAARPNVVFVLTDDMRDDDLVHMPITRRLLVDQGMEFTDAISPHPLCCPARAQLVTGQYAQNNGVQHNRGPYGGFPALDPTRESSSWFRDAGYQTGFVGKFLNGYGPGDVEPSGWTRWDALQTGVYDYFDFTMSGDGSARRFTDSYVTEVISRRTDDLVREFSATTDPFVVFAWHVAPHYRIARGSGPTVPPPAPQDRRLFEDIHPVPLSDPAFNEAEISDQPTYFRDRPFVEPAEVAEHHRARLRSLQSVDRAVGSLIDTLAATGELEDTYIVFSSDNGYSLGEHRYVGKDKLTRSSLQVPLVVRGPGIAPGTSSDLPATLVDVPATIAGLAGVSPGWVVDGTSLAPTLEGAAQPFRDTTLVQTGSALGDGWGYRGVRTARYLYAVDGADGILYDTEVDPHETVNRFSDPAYAEVREALDRRRDQLVDCSGWTCNQVFGPLPEPAERPDRGIR
ncbi:sulfatase family protein [Nocardioides seonyuensis]|nr:sulfatase [Nocardioides seonyuensis]